MPRAAGSWIDQVEERTAFCAKLKRRDGTIVGFTDHDRDLSIDIGDGDGIVLYPKGRVVNFAAISAFLELGQLDDTELSGAFEADGITRDELRAGLWRGATVTIFSCNYEDPDERIVELTGDCAEWSAGDFGWKVAIYGIKARWQGRILKVITPYCLADFGSMEGAFFCGRELEPADRQNEEDVELGEYRRNPIFDDRDYKCVQEGTTGVAPPTYDSTIGAEFSDGTVIWRCVRAAVPNAGTVAASIDALTFQVGGINAAEYPDGWFAFGAVEFTSGAMAGAKNLDVIGWVSATATITLAEPLPLDIEVGDTVKLTAGCNKTKDQGVVNCEAHDNFVTAPGKGGFRGFEGVPTISEKAEIVRSGGSSGGKK